jgi:hypothetical protein
MAGRWRIQSGPSPSTAGGVGRSDPAVGGLWKAPTCWSSAGWSAAEGVGSLGDRDLSCSPPLPDPGRQRRRSEWWLRAAAYGRWRAECWSAKAAWGLGSFPSPIDSARWPTFGVEANGERQSGVGRELDDNCEGEEGNWLLPWQCEDKAHGGAHGRRLHVEAGRQVARIRAAAGAIRTQR